MTRFLLDTNILSDVIRNPDGIAAERLWREAESACASLVSAAELRYGVQKRGSRRLAERVEALLASVPVFGWESPADRHYASLRVALEASGRPISGNDMLIAAHALALGCTLVTANEREFRRVPGLGVENWVA